MSYLADFPPFSKAHSFTGSKKAVSSTFIQHTATFGLKKFPQTININFFIETFSNLKFPTMTKQ